MNDSTPKLLERQLSVDELQAVLAVLNKHLAENGLVIFEHGNQFSVVNHAPNAYFELSRHNTLAEVYASALDTLVEGVIWEATNGGAK